MTRCFPKSAVRAAGLAALVVSLSALAPAALAKAPEPVALDAAFNAAQMATRVTEVLEAAALKGVTRVAVPQFSVQFVTTDSASAETSAAGGSRARVSVNYKLVGVGEAEFQAMVNGLYADLLRELRSSGLEVLPFEQVAAAATYPKLVASGVAAPVREDGYITVAPTGMALYGVNRAVAAGPAKNSGLMGALAGFGTIASAIGSAGDTVALGQELGNAALLDVHLRVNFVELTNNNKGFLGRFSDTASVSAKSAPSIASATMGVQVGHQRSTVYLVPPLTLDAAAFSEVRKQPKTGGDVAGAVLTGLIRLAAGSKDSSSYDTYEAVADPARYREVVGGGLGVVNQMFVQRLKSER